MIGKNVLHYRIIEKLGEGGMGKVYLAEDTKLERKVAIKFLPEHLTKDKENVERFEREAKAAASLNHPNIVTIYEINEFDGQIFIVLEYIDGHTLREQLIADCQLPTAVCIDIITQICQGLSKAHAAGIIHRDIKPENILIDKDGRVKILDFGLAKLKGVSKLTKETSTLGTVHYMSPEQIQGQEVDQRSDIWSLGVMFYEMLTGEVPFQGEYEQAVTYAIINEEPKLSKEIESKYSPEFSSIIFKMISKRSEHRYQNCMDLIDDLENESKIKLKVTKTFSKKTYAVSSIIAVTIILLITIFYLSPVQNDTVSIKSLAVLPFINQEDDKELDWLGMSLASDIIGGLYYLHSINVRPAISVQVYRDKNVDRKSAGIDLNVDFILDGSYWRDGDLIRLDIELIDVHEEKILLYEKIDKRYVAKFKLRDNISETLIRRLKIKLTPQEEDRMTKDEPKNALAHDYYFKSLSFDLSNEGNANALELLSKSIQIDSSYAPAFTELGYRMRVQTQNFFSGKKGLEKAKRYFEKALEQNSENLTALIELNGIYTEMGKHDSSMNYINRVIEINPNNAMAHFRQSYLYRFVGLLELSEKSARKALELDSQNKRFRSIGHTYKYLGNYEKAIKVYSIDPSAYSYAQRGDVYLRMDKIALAQESLERVIENEIDTFPEFCAKGILAYIRNEKDEGLKILHEWEEKDLYDSEMIYRLASNYGLLGDRKNCIRVLKKAIEGGFCCYPFMLRDEFLQSVRDDPEFNEVLNMAKEKQEAFKKKYFPEEQL